MKRIAHPPRSCSGHETLTLYEHWLREGEDLTQPSIRTSLSDLHHFIAWFETQRETNANDDATFTPQAITTTALTRYRSYLQTIQRQKPASVNRSLISLKRSFGWVTQRHSSASDLSVVVKLVRQEHTAPRHVDDQEEQALVAAVINGGNLWDRILIVLLLHTGLRAREICRLRCDQVKLGRRSGVLEIIGKRNTLRAVAFSATARNVLEDSLAILPVDTAFMLPSGKTREGLSERALGSLVKKYATAAPLPDASPHDVRHRFGYRMAASVPLHRLAHIMGYDSLDTTRFSIQGTRHDLQQAVETIAWT